MGGIHAREVVNPDLLVLLAVKLCDAYGSGGGLTFGARSYGAADVKSIVEALDLFVLPLANPDGRAYVQSATGDAFWRKNRSPNPGLTCQGVDLNRNYDFLWSSGIGTSGDGCSDVFRGPSAFSEPETRNVRHLLDAHEQISTFIDVHSYGELILYPWGDDDNQSTDREMNFANPAFDGLRGTAGDTAYREYIASADLERFDSTGVGMREAIADARGTTYDLQQAVLLYPTSGTAKDYAYSRHVVDASKRKVLAYTVETATEFQPPYAEALEVMSEVSAGLIELCLTASRAAQQAAGAAP